VDSVRLPRARKPPDRYTPAFAATKQQGVGAAPRVPQTHEQAVVSPQAEEWLAAEQRELAQLYGAGTWTLEPLPAGSRAIPCRWVYTLKRNGTYKARLVAKGFMQRAGIDYDEVFAPTSRLTSLRVLLAVAAHRDLELHQLDVESAFLNGELHETVYMQQPPGYGLGDSRLVCRLWKSLYGLKQAPRAWHNTLREVLLGAGFEESAADPALFIKVSGSGEMLLMHVDDLVLAATSVAELEATKATLGAHFAVKDLGPVSDYLGMDVRRDRSSRQITLSQQRYALELIEKFGMADAAPRSSPMPEGAQLVRTGLLGGPEQEPLPDADASTYRALVGGLLYLANCTRPDLAFAVGVLARFMSAPTAAHWEAGKHVLRYLRGTAGLGLCFGGEGGTGELEQVVGFADADYGGERDSRRSTTGCVFLLNGAGVSWLSRLQHTVALSTTEAEYQAAAMAAKEALWLRNLLADMGLPLAGPLQMYGDNQSALALIKNPVVHDRSKHIDIMHHFVRQRCARMELSYDYCSTQLMIADALTKALPLPKFVFCREGMGVR
jgi:hypothetical protein